jgi:hypothetical protein
MKRVIISISLLVLSFFLSIFSLSLTASISDSISQQAGKLEYLLSKEDTSSLSAYDDLKNQWDLDYKILSTYISHQHLEDTEKNMVLLGEYIRSGNYTTAQILCAQISASLEHLYRSERPEVQNIF